MKENRQSNNLFVGIAYFLLGDKDDGIKCVEVNIDFDYEYKISGMILAQMKKGKLDTSDIRKELRMSYENAMNEGKNSKIKPDVEILRTSQDEEKKRY